MLSTRAWHLGTTIFVSKYCVYTGGGVGGGVGWGGVGWGGGTGCGWTSRTCTRGQLRSEGPEWDL